jgi:hypothetical protein
MQRLFFLSSVLFAAASDSPQGGGGSPAAPAPETPAPAAGDPPAPANPSLLDRARGIVHSHGTLVSANRTLTADNARLTAENARLNTELTAARNELATLRTERDQLSSSLSQAQSERQSLDEAVVHELASMGVPEKTLPATSTKIPAMDLEAAVEAMAAAKDPAERGRLAAKVKQLRAAAKQN